MPTYQYACTECDNAFEQFQSFTDDALTVCPQCQGKLRKVFSSVGVVFKGSGFYKTDSRSANGSGSSSSSSTPSTPSTSSTGSSDSGSSTSSSTSSPDSSSSTPSSGSSSSTSSKKDTSAA